jgi:hypothetical protein
MKRFALALLALLGSGSACGDRLYSDGFDPYVIDPLFPLVGGDYVLPPGPAADQLDWLLGELAVGETTTFAEIDAHFDASWPFTDQQTVDFIASLRTSFPDAVVRDVVSVTPVLLTVVIDSPGGSAPHGYLVLGTRYAGTQGIVQLGSQNYFGSVQYPEDHALDLTQAADKFETLSEAPALLVARIEPDGQCSALVDRNADQLRATASVFKIWVLGGVGRALAEGLATAGESIAMVASELAPGGTINSEPLGTVFSLADLAILMMGISDNTATDLLHERIGREAIGEVIRDFDVALPEVLTPLLGISEQFHLLYSFSLEVAQAYVDGSEAFQQQFLEEQIEPLGSLVGDPLPFFNESLLTSGTWRASPADICRAFAHLRRLPQGSDAIAVVDRALGAQAAQPEVRNAWDRVWYKGGSLSASSTELRVLTHAWMLENAGEEPYVVIAMSNSDSGTIDQFAVQSVTGRILELVAQMR